MKYTKKAEAGHISPFTLDCIKEAGVKPVKGWEHPQHHKEFNRFANWVRRVLEECNWWELDGSARNVNAHLQLRLLTIYKDIIEKELIPLEYMKGQRLPRNEGVEPRQPEWQEWYDQRSKEAWLWYQHWCRHISSVAIAFRPEDHQRLQRFRSTFQVLKAAPSRERLTERGPELSLS